MMKIPVEQDHGLKHAKLEIGKPFRVCPQRISKALFKVPRVDAWQELIRSDILEVLEKAKRNRVSSFWAFIPEKTFPATIDAQVEIRDYSEKNGDHLAYYREFLYITAQRIQNGESWESLCNDPDTFPYRLVIYSSSMYDMRLIGGSTKDSLALCPTNSHPMGDCYGALCSKVSPLIIRYVI